MSATIYFITLGVMFGTPLLIFGMKYLSAAQQARSRVLTDKAAAAQAQMAATLATLQTAQADIATRLAAVEKLLKTVE